jgi:hypothetical protein
MYLQATSNSDKSAAELVGALRRIKDKALEISMSSNSSNIQKKNKQQSSSSRDKMPKKPLKRSKERKVVTNPMSP